MKLYLHRDYEQAQEGEMLLTFDEPDDLENWYTLTTKEHHYSEIVDDLEHLIDKFIKENDHRSANIAKTLAQKLRGQIPISIIQ